MNAPSVQSSTKVHSGLTSKETDQEQGCDAANFGSSQSEHQSQQSQQGIDQIAIYGGGFGLTSALASATVSPASKQNPNPISLQEDQNAQNEIFAEQERPPLDNPQQLQLLQRKNNNMPSPSETLSVLQKAAEVLQEHSDEQLVLASSADEECVYSSGNRDDEGSILAPGIPLKVASVFCDQVGTGWDRERDGGRRDKR